ncbi:pentapeptide repeat-containing protein [Erwinia phyllosphaerae]|uniref:pentapeptide repeat-containing protein n=1 Tax=Erwinia phyllosphaerae TaxID=2853256 RepID=UPI001FED3C2C|nr:pentapeptide repeat-containing protein [Erwinia phyllosphaerae]MBV4365547.1 pentapeptide repeat-containing protein [Erwinia phyllosphaerae]
MTQLSGNKEYFDDAFSRLDLSSALIKDAIFEDCEFSHCNFTSAHFSRCKFINCTFMHCNLSMMEISGTRINESSFNECKLSGIDWTRAYWPAFNVDPELSFAKCILTNASFFGLTLQGLKLIECKLHEVDFRECDLSSAEITGCDLAGSLFSNTNLRGADFTDSWNFNINVLNNLVARAKFSRPEAVSLLEGLDIDLVD